MAGPAFTAQGAPGDNLALHHAVAQAASGDVIVLAVGGERGRAHCGVLSAAAEALEAREREILTEIGKGKTTVEIYGYEPL